MTCKFQFSKGALPLVGSPLVFWRPVGMMPIDHKDIVGRSKVIHPFPEAVMAIMEPKKMTDVLLMSYDSYDVICW